MKLYIVGPEDKGEGPYYLITEKGVCIANHFCSSSGFSEGDLITHRPERIEEWKKKFDVESFEVEFADKEKQKELIELNKKREVKSSANKH